MNADSDSDSDRAEPDARHDQRTPGGQHLQTPSKADQRTAVAVENRRIDFSDEFGIRELCLDLHVAPEELKEGVAAVGDRWLDVRAYLT